MPMETSDTLRPLPRIKGYRWKPEHAEAWPHAGVEWHAYLTTPGGAQIAMLTTILYPDHVLLRFLFVHKDFRQSGLGGKMLQAFLDTYPDLPIRLKVKPDSDDAPLDAAQLAAWYGRFGFVAVESPWMVRPVP
jgi:GNAT superfamily N-acetyltransferase